MRPTVLALCFGPAFSAAIGCRPVNAARQSRSKAPFSHFAGLKRLTPCERRSGQRSATPRRHQLGSNSIIRACQQDTSTHAEASAASEMAAPRVLVIGAGPIGIEVAINAVNRGHPVTLLEKGAAIAQNVRDWKHVRLFSPWSLNASVTGKQALAKMGVDVSPFESDAAYPTGEELVDLYLQPLCDSLQQSGLCEIETNAEVVAIGRGLLLKGQALGSKRKGMPFRVQYKNTADSTFKMCTADIVVDASGTYGNGNWIGAGGIPALGELDPAVAPHVLRTIPDVLGRDRDRFLDRQVAVVGSGASAITTLNGLKDLAASAPDHSVTVHWVTRHGSAPYQRVENDPLPQRDRLAVLGNELASGAASTEQPENFKLRYHGQAHVTEVGRGRGGEPALRLELESFAGADSGAGPAAAASTLEVDCVVANVGYRPDTDILRELQVHQCYASEGPMKLAAAMMAAAGGGGDCLQQVAPGPATMLNPEPDLFIAGMKSYGRGSAFLMRVGFEQVANIMHLIAEREGK